MRKPLKNRVQISELKPNLSRYLRAAQRGRRTTVLDRETPIAVIGPVGGAPEEKGLEVIPAVQSHEALAGIAVSPIRGKVDSLALLLEERGER